MDESVLFMPPCCVGVKLPKAIMAAPQRALTFYTEGNITMEALYRAVSYFVEPPMVMVLAMPVMEKDTFVFLQSCFRKGEISDLVLSTTRDYSTMVDKCLGEYAKHVIYKDSEMVNDFVSHMVLYSDRNAMTICGPMLARASTCMNMCYNLHLHIGYGTFSNKAYGHPVLNVVRNDMMRFSGRWRLDHNEHAKSKRIQQFLNHDLPRFNPDL